MTVSVAICAYNGAGYIEEQIRSVLAQTVPPDEVVVCDDGSNDATAAIVRAVATGSAVPIRFHSNPSRLGVTRNFQKAIGLCSGDVIFLADQDDVWYPAKIERMTEPFRRDPKVGLAYCDAAITDGALVPTGTTVFGSRGRSRVREGMDRDPRDILKRPNIKGCTMAISRAVAGIALPIPEADGKSVWTHDNWLAFAAHCVSSVVVVDEILMLYRIHANNASGLVGTASAAGVGTEGPYRSLFSSSLARERSRLYAYLLEFLRGLGAVTSIKPTALARSLEAVMIEDKALLDDRIDIWETRNLFRRAVKIARFLIRGRYSRFKRGSAQVLRDLAGIRG